MIKWQEVGRLSPSDRTETKNRMFMELMQDVYGPDVEEKKPLRELIELHRDVAKLVLLKPTAKKEDDGFDVRPKKVLPN